MLQKLLSKQQLVQKSITSTEKDLKCVESGNAEHIHRGADKSEVDDRCLNCTFYLNSTASTFPESSPDKDDIVHPENKVEVQPEEAPLMDPTEGTTLKPDLNLMVESMDENGANPNSPKSSYDEKGFTHLVFAASNSDQGIMEDVLSSFEEDEDIDDDNEQGHAFVEENTDEVDDQEQNDES